LLLKDNETVPLSDWTTEQQSEPAIAPFPADQMVRCETCLRANAPTRLNCLYCGAGLPQTEKTRELQKPLLRPLEKWEQGYNNILTTAASDLKPETLEAAADILRLPADELRNLLASAIPLPLARPATFNEAQLIERRLQDLGINSCIMPDAELSLDAMPLRKIRALEFDETGIFAYQSPETEAIQIDWKDIALIVSGRLLFKRVELTEQTGARVDTIVDASEFTTDETVFDFYTREATASYRVAANSFDFSCLGSAKGLLSSANLSTLIERLRLRGGTVVYDDGFNRVRRLLEIVWPAEQQNESSGWHRHRPGKYSVGTVTGVNNETQFLRYSRLRYWLSVAERAKRPGE
jgi:hypothetical protein